MIAPFLPARSIALAINLPITLSLLEDTVAMFSISSIELIDFDLELIKAITSSFAFSMPLLISVGEMPDERYFCDSFNIRYARRVLVVVPSPASCAVSIETCLRICAPAFSNGSSKSTKRATVTPSFVMIGLLSFC